MTSNSPVQSSRHFKDVLVRTKSLRSQVSWGRTGNLAYDIHGSAASLTQCQLTCGGAGVLVPVLTVVFHKPGKAANSSALASFTVVSETIAIAIHKALFTMILGT
jgi:hypothetical protein